MVSTMSESSNAQLDDPLALLPPGHLALGDYLQKLRRVRD
jgi:hypothetical protein